MKKIKNIILTFILMFAIMGVAKAEDVAKIGETKYDTITNAINNVMESETITLLSDISEMTIPKNKVVTLDLGSFNVRKITNNGNLKLTGEGTIYNSYSGPSIINNSGAQLLINSITFESNATTAWIIDNFGDITISSGVFTYNEEETEFPKFIKNETSGKITINNGSFKGSTIFENSGVMNIKGGNFETLSTGGSSYNHGTLTIDGGEFKSTKDRFFLNKAGTLTINSGTFDVSSVAENNLSEENSTINVNGGTFNAKDTAFSTSTSSDNCIINIRGGVITSTTTDYILEIHSNNSNIHITGGEINSLYGKGIFVSGSSTLIIGENDDFVSKTTPTINISSGEVIPFGKSNFNFYDGKIILASQVSGFSEVLVPNGYYVKYDLNDDGTYTAYLEEYSNKVSDKINKEENKSDTKAEETVKNPNTGINLEYGILILIIIISISLYMIIKNKSKFPKHN